MSKTIRSIYKEVTKKKYLVPVYFKIIESEFYFQQHPEMITKLYQEAYNRITGQCKKVGLAKQLVVRKWLRYILKYGYCNAIPFEYPSPPKRESVIKISQYFSNISRLTTKDVQDFKLQSSQSLENVFNAGKLKHYIKTGIIPESFDEDMYKRWIPEYLTDSFF